MPFLVPALELSIRSNVVDTARDGETITDKRKLETERSYEELIERFHKWAENRLDIKAAVVIGSRARVDHAADEWADLDIVMITTDPKRYVSASDWIRNFGKPLLTFIEPTSTGDEEERRVLYEGMLDVDFAIVPLEKAQSLIQAGTDPQAAAQISNLLGRGMRVLIDRDGLADQLQMLVASTKETAPHRPKEDEFLKVVNDFIYHAVFTAKHLRRGEFWWAVTCLNCHMQQLVLQMMEWHTLATHDWKHDTWFRGRFLEEWAHPKAVERLRTAFARYDKEDIKLALFATTNLFRWLATETAAKLSYAYPAETDDHVTKWIRKCLSEVRNVK